MKTNEQISRVAFSSFRVLTNSEMLKIRGGEDPEPPREDPKPGNDDEIPPDPIKK
jgi:hypothetical protein